METWHWFALALLALYAFVGFLWGAALNALTAPSGDVVSGWAVLHGVLWPLSLSGLLHRE